MEQAKLDELMEIIKNSNRIVFFSGAGVSVASGIPDFRGARGIYKEAPEEIVSHNYFMYNTKKFYDFYFDKMVYKNALPNECHKAVAYLNKKGKISGVVTQNIDSLDKIAGTNPVIEIHGTIWKNHCMKCHKYYELNDISKDKYICSCGGLIKPDVVLYGEDLNYSDIENAINLISSCDTLIVAGTSLVVYPAASFVNYFKGKKLVLINLGETQISNRADLFINGKVEEYLNIENLKKYNL